VKESRKMPPNFTRPDKPVSKIKVILHGSSDNYPVTYVGNYRKYYNTKLKVNILVVWGKEVFGSGESVWTFYEPLCSWQIL